MTDDLRSGNEYERGYHDAYRQGACRAEELQGEIARLREALERCRDRFNEYARIHAAKIDSTKQVFSFEDKENLGKYDRNKAMVRLCEDALE